MAYAPQTRQITATCPKTGLVFKRRTARIYTHALVSPGAIGASGNPYPARAQAWCGRQDLAARALAKAPAGWWLVPVDPEPVKPVKFKKVQGLLNELLG